MSIRSLTAEDPDSGVVHIGTLVRIDAPCLKHRNYRLGINRTRLMLAILLSFHSFSPIDLSLFPNLGHLRIGLASDRYPILSITFWANRDAVRKEGCLELDAKLSTLPCSPYLLWNSRWIRRNTMISRSS
jgi:hypothetical protein